MPTAGRITTLAAPSRSSRRCSTPRRMPTTRGWPTLTEDQFRAACGEAKAHGRRCVVHAHAAEAARRAVLGGATSIEHGVLLDEATLDLMAEHGTFFDPNLYLVFQNYFDNKAQ